VTQVIQDSLESLIKEFKSTRRTTLNMFSQLKHEDAVIQASDFGSPPNWHLAHVSWFYQKVLEKHGVKITLPEEINLAYLNSYYQKYDFILSKPERGRFPRPTIRQTLQYRSIIDKEVVRFLKNWNIGYHDGAYYDIKLANQHEMQHQELMIYDLQYYFNRFVDPDDNFRPSIMQRFEATQTDLPTESNNLPKLHHSMVEISGGIYNLGYPGDQFCYDNELPEHKVYLENYQIDVYPVTNGDFLRFVDEGGYEDFNLWLADGWDLVREQQWKAPLFWNYEKGEECWMKKDFRGKTTLDPREPVVNVSFYEASAYARWAGKRLPTEAEWEKAASWNEKLQRKFLYPWGDDMNVNKYANVLESNIWAPTRIGTYKQGRSHFGCFQMIGDVWEWTSSEYSLYPRFRTKFPEYTDKWSINQKVLRGGSFATPCMQIRNSYRNYFRPYERILFSGFRCAADA
jgi:ergothioneine biosynthesis protein EgtB